MSAKTSPLLLKIKNEVNDEIKEYAESAMNELLGWYGYCNNNTDHSTEQFNSLNNSKISAPNFATVLSQSASFASMNQSRPKSITMAYNRKRENSLSLDENTTDSMSFVDEMTKSAPQKNGIVTPTSAATTTATSLEKSSPGSQTDECGWCKRVIAFGSTEFTATSEGLKYCSESCFTQSRRASYKRAKTCDWCKHTRHAVSYVDFQDGASQLQFCSDKCLNQYKMQIFCKETQAHLDLNPHLKEKLKSSSETLITPELWMKNCRSRSLTPDQRSNDSRATESPISNIMATVNQMPNIKVAPASKLMSCELDLTKHQKKDDHQATSAAELKSYPHFTQKSRAIKKRRINRSNSNSNSILSSGNVSESSSNNNDSSNENRNIHAAIINNTPNMIGDKNRMNLLQPPLMTNVAPTISPVDESNATFLQRYQLMSSQHTPHLLAMNENRSLQNALRQSAPFIAPLIPNHSFGDAVHVEPIPKIPTPQMPSYPSMQRQRPESIASSTARKNYNDMDNNRYILKPQQHHSHHLHHHHHQQQQQQQQQQQRQQQKSLNDFVGNMFGTIAPPSTLLIPYPIILPLPLPIPIPLPYEVFLKAAESNPRTNANSGARSDIGNADTEKANNSFTRKNDYKPNSNDQPLDFTKEKMVRGVRNMTENELNKDDDRIVNSGQEDGTPLHLKADYPKTDLSKFKLNRQTNKRTFTKETMSENNRPLRKRKRIIDCDYLRLRDSNSNESTHSRKSI